MGWGALDCLPALLADYLAPMVVARGGASFIPFAARLRAFGLDWVELPPQTREPEPDDVDAAVAVARAAGARAVLAIGGGSVIDLGKAVAALVPQDPPAPVRDFLEGVGMGRALAQHPLPFIAVPTTAGTGAEATKNAVISSHAGAFKKSLRDPRMVADTVLLDAEHTVPLPPHLTAQSGLDAINQLIEAYTTRNAQPVTDALALKGLHLARALPDAVENGANRPAREAMLLAAYLSGLCLANAGLGAAHGIAAALGAVADVPHGLACALALPWVMAANLPAVADRYREIAVVFNDDPFAEPPSAITGVWNLLRRLNTPRVTELPALAGVFDDDNLPALAAACHGNSLRGNPLPLDDAALIHLLRRMRDAESPV
jgi:alcohol dehydrogenase class IV